MKSLMLLWQCLAEEFGERCSVSTDRDFKTVTARVEREGLSFLAITLPAFCKELEKALSIGQVTPDAFPGFRKYAKLPRFLGGFMELVFDSSDGRLLDSPRLDAIHAMRQLTLPYGKMEMLTSKERELATYWGFVECEKEVKTSDSKRTSSLVEEFRSTANVLWSNVLTEVDHALYEEQRQSGLTSRDSGWPYVRPKHGPGATAERKSGNRKYVFTEWTQRLERVFPAGEYVLPSWRYFDYLDRVAFLEPGAERPVRVISVPKTLKAPRLIAIEPSYMQFMQQAVKELLVTSIQKDDLLGSVVGFDDQFRNHELALRGSIDGSLATLDLSEASDRVSNQLVRDMLRNFPHLFEAVDATRSRKADVPGHGVLRLAKFASMGSALTFPVEAMVFATIVYIGVARAKCRPLSRKDVKSLAGSVRVYGDDIIVPTDYAHFVITALEDFGLKVNVNKSFLSGNFRESCGKEYYAGYDVSVVRVRKVVQEDNFVGFPTSRRHAREVESLVNLRNRFYLAGLWKTARYLDGLIKPLLGGHYPTIEARPLDPDKDPEARTRVLGRYSVMGYEVHGTDSQLHSPLVKGWVVQDRRVESPLDDLGALLKVLQPRELPFEDPEHLVYAGRPDAARSKLKLRMASPL